MPAITGQRIVVEIAQAIQRPTGQHAIVQRLLQHIGITGRAIQLQHTPLPQHVGHRSARLGIGRAVGQLIITAKCLAAGPRPHTAAQVHLPRGHLPPLPLQGSPQGRLARFRQQVGGSHVQVQGAHRMPGRGRQLAERQMILVVNPATNQPPAAQIQETLRLRQISAVTGDAIQRHQRQLNLLMPWHSRLPGRAKTVADMVRQADGHPQEVVPAGGPVMGHRRFNQVASTVQLMLVSQVLPALACPLKHEIAVDVAIRLLRRRNRRDHAISHLRQGHVGRLGRQPGHRLQPLVHIRVIVVAPLERLVQPAGRAVQVLHPAGRFALGILRRQTHRTQQRPPRPPKCILKRDRRQRHRPELAAR